jgi:dTDP-4-dehydrorhamnose 3,5-epimerase
MRFIETSVEGAFVVELQGHSDARGRFARSFCEEEFARAGIKIRVVQTNLSCNPKRLTLRGLHYQAEPHGEPKLVQCVHGRIFDVAVDLRPGSPSLRRWAGVELAPQNNRVFYIPPGCAHGFLTLEADSDVAYLMGAPHVAGSGRGVRWNDPAFAVAWPDVPVEISERDASYPDLPGGAQPEPCRMPDLRRAAAGADGLSTGREGPG